MLDSCCLARHAALLERAARTGSARPAVGAEPTDAPPVATAAAPLPLSGPDGGGGVDIAEARSARRAAAPVRCAALRALARAWATADDASRTACAHSAFETALLCAVSEWDVRVRALELLGELHGGGDGKSAPAGARALPPALAAPDALSRALGACRDGLDDGKFVAVRKAACGALLALVDAAGAQLPAQLRASTRAAVSEARTREKDAPTAVLLARVSACLDALG